MASSSSSGLGGMLWGTEALLVWVHVCGAKLGCGRWNGACFHGFMVCLRAVCEWSLVSSTGCLHLVLVLDTACHM